MSTHPFQTFSLSIIEIATLSVFIDRWANRPPDTISQYLYEDSVYRRLFTLYTLLHIIVLFLSTKDPYQHSALIAMTIGWVWLIVCTNHGSRPLHIVGAVIYIVGIFVFTYLHSLDYQSCALQVAIQVLTALSVCLACVFAYFESHRAPTTYIIEHSLYVMCQVMYAFFVHFPAIIYEPGASLPEVTPCHALTSSSTTSALPSPAL